MTGKFKAINKLSIKADNDHEKLLVDNFKALSTTKTLSIDLEESEPGFVVFKVEGESEPSQNDNQ